MFLKRTELLRCMWHENPTLYNKIAHIFLNQIKWFALEMMAINHKINFSFAYFLINTNHDITFDLIIQIEQIQSEQMLNETASLKLVYNDIQTVS